MQYLVILNSFSEYVSGKKTNIQLRSLSSSDPLIYVGVITSVAVALAKAVDWIIDAYKKVLEVKLIKQQLNQIGVPEENVKGIEDYSNNIMKNKIEEIITMLRELYCQAKDNGRKNELENALSISLNKIANRIDAGYSYEIRIGVLPEPKAEENEDERKKMEDAYSEIKKVEKNITFMNLKGSKILSLPEKMPKEKEK